MQSKVAQPEVNWEEQLESVLRESAYLKNLGINWDEEGALPISGEVFEATASFLKKYVGYLADMDVPIQLPEINPVKDGSIDLEWQAPKAQLLINIRRKENAYYAYYYGDLYNNKMPNKGNVPLTEFSEPLAVWMKYLV